MENSVGLLLNIYITFAKVQSGKTTDIPKPSECSAVQKQASTQVFCPPVSKKAPIVFNLPRKDVQDWMNSLGMMIHARTEAPGLLLLPIGKDCFVSRHGRVAENPTRTKTSLPGLILIFRWPAVRFLYYLSLIIFLDLDF